MLLLLLLFFRCCFGPQFTVRAQVYGCLIGAMWLAGAEQLCCLCALCGTTFGIVLW